MPIASRDSITRNEASTISGDWGFSLSQTAGPVAWGGGRWPNVDWICGELIWVGWEAGNVVTRVVSQSRSTGLLTITGNADPLLDRTWVTAVLGYASVMPDFEDPVMARLAQEMPGLRPFANGSLFEGVIGSIVGQSISVASAATTERRLAALFHPGVDVGNRTFYPSPRPEDLASCPVEELRSTGVTWRRAEAIQACAHAWLNGTFPEAPCDPDLPEDTRAALRALPLVGPWTAESALLWGLGLPDIYPSGDVALLRAARLAYAEPEMTMKELDTRSRDWSPARSWASRLLWTDLLGPAPTG